MGRKLKHHEQKLLRKVDFNTYKSDNDHRDAAVMRRYGLQKREVCYPLFCMLGKNRIEINIFSLVGLRQIQPAGWQSEGTAHSPIRAQGN